ncbi:MAG: peptide chain release factor N(5)-glutamine methyltransferase [Bacteroidota bacterium]
MNVIEAIEKTKAEFGELYSIEERDQIIALIFESMLGFSKIDLRLKGDSILSPEMLNQLSAISNRIILKEPVQYILGFSWFAGMKLKVTPDVLIPRQETEELVDWIVKENKKKDPLILDLCTGSGCIALALKKNISQANIRAIDISETALKIASENAFSNDLDVEFVQSDILESDIGTNEVDIIVSNPPYVRISEAKLMSPNVVDFEPHLALFVSDADPLIFYKRLAILAKKSLKKSGKIYLEINENLSKETMAILELQGFHDIRIRKDLNDRFRMVSATNP